MNDDVWVVRIEDGESATFAYAFQLKAGETPRAVAQSIADDRDCRLIQVMPVRDFICGDLYELCSV